MPECKQVEKFQSRKLGTKAVSKSSVFGVHTIPQSVTFPSRFVTVKVTVSYNFVPASCEQKGKK